MTDKFKPVPNAPKTYEQFVLEDKQLISEQGQDLYPELDLYYSCGNSLAPKVYGPGEDWAWLRIPCPAQGCPDTSKECKDWVHKRDECLSPTSYLKWSTEARLKCDYCQNPSHIKYWTFRCHRHTEYLPHDGTKFTRAISIALRARNIDENFANKLLDWLEDHPY